MLKWILGGLLVLAVGLGGTCWYGYKKVTAGGDTAEIAIAGSRERVFASLINTDSMSLWMSQGTIVTPRGRDLVPGDTLRIEGRIGDNTASRQDMTWIVREVAAPSLIVMSLADTTGHEIFVRRDELATRNDSTILVTKFASPLMDSVGTANRDSGRVASGVIGGVQKLLVSGARLAAEMELKQLKARVEGTTVSP